MKMATRNEQKDPTKTASIICIIVLLAGFLFADQISIQLTNWMLNIN